MSFLSNITSIFDKLLPTQKRRDINRLKELEKLYAGALTSRQDTNAAIYRKEMKDLREILGYAETN